ncbi:S-adenosyl-L-methionine-dependent methyltransferase [Aspergillus avenaceus]|uniref:S-adenosyl-L-methionine-dependent methyltransferase n=1 Tax=Aspergillus avenaceus TaxID=36643 RepID=A0A5N6U7F7_ASPAV|nr:S-adenosyl-L-methionine-dependent methyltransferase [Aspergillus avenaceus]
MSLARRAATALESPFDVFQRIIFTALPIVAVRTCQEHNVLLHLVEDARKNHPATRITDLVEKTGLSKSTLQTLLDYMGTLSFVIRLSLDEFKPSPLTEMLLSPLFIDGIRFYHDMVTHAFLGLNGALSKRDDNITAFGLAHNTPGGPYDWFETDPVLKHAFETYMKEEYKTLPGWLDAVDFPEGFAQDMTSDTPVFVDVGGGIGQQCGYLFDKYPDLKGRIILQDLPSVIPDAITSPRVERMCYDYFTEQPVKGARANYFRQVLHNNNPDACVRILRSFLPAMDPSSVLLIHEKVLADHETPPEYTAGLSMTMLAMFNNHERRESEWRSFLDEAGFKVRAIKTFTDFGDSIIEAVKK